VKVPSTWDAAQDAAQNVLDEVVRLGYDESDTFSIRLALEEGLINAVKHGNRSDASKSVELAYDVTPESVTIVITDEGQGFRPGGLPDPTQDENLEKTTGRGVMLMRAFMDSVEYGEAGNTVRLFKRRTQGTTNG